MKERTLRFFLLAGFLILLLFGVAAAVLFFGGESPKLSYLEPHQIITPTPGTEQQDSVEANTPQPTPVHLIRTPAPVLPENAVNLISDGDALFALDSREMARLVVFTKADKISPGKRKAQYNAFVRTGIDSVLPPFMTCGVNDISMQKLRDGIIRVIQEMTRLDEAETH